MNLKNKKILITGATGGIGNCIVEKLNSFDSKIIATGTNEEKLENLKKKFPKIYIEKFKLDEHEKIDFTNVKNNFLYNLDNFKERSNLFEDTSDMFFEKLNKDKKVYDIIYIDGSHHSKQVFKDAENSFNCIKINGLIIFDDFLREYYDEKDQNTIGGALSFLEKYKNKVKLEFVHYQLFITKIRN